MLVKQVKKGRLTIEEAAEDAAMSVEELLNFLNIVGTIKKKDIIV